MSWWRLNRELAAVRTKIVSRVWRCRGGRESELFAVPSRSRRSRSFRSLNTVQCLATGSLVFQCSSATFQRIAASVESFRSAAGSSKRNVRRVHFDSNIASSQPAICERARPPAEIAVSTCIDKARVKVTNDVLLLAIVRGE